MESLSGVRVLPGRHGTWYTGNGRSILVAEQVQPLTPPDEVSRAIEDNGLLDNHERRYGATVMLTTRCNLTCSYCFQNESFDDSGLARIARTDLTVQTATLARDFVSEQMNKYGKSELHLLLTGGEPLIKFRRCLEVLDAMAALNLTQASMFTNGVLLSRKHAQLRSRNRGSPTFKCPSTVLPPCAMSTARPRRVSAHTGESWRTWQARLIPQRACKSPRA